MVHVIPDDAFEDWIVREDGGRELVFRHAMLPKWLPAPFCADVVAQFWICQYQSVEKS
jgi:hypothetical protein